MLRFFPRPRRRPQKEAGSSWSAGTWAGGGPEEPSRSGKLCQIPEPPVRPLSCYAPPGTGCMRRSLEHPGPTNVRPAAALCRCMAVARPDSASSLGASHPGDARMQTWGRAGGQEVPLVSSIPPVRHKPVGDCLAAGDHAQDGGDGDGGNDESKLGCGVRRRKKTGVVPPRGTRAVLTYQGSYFKS
jgi:hypothetical protein